MTVIEADVVVIGVGSVGSMASWQLAARGLRVVGIDRFWVGTFLTGLVPRPVRMVVCADGYTVDETGLLGHVPGMNGVVVAIGFSGHGFKMAASLGAVAGRPDLGGYNQHGRQLYGSHALSGAATDHRSSSTGRYRTMTGTAF